MPGQGKTAVAAGLFVLATGIVMIGAIAMLAQRNEIFTEHVLMKAKFGDVQGLLEDAPVRIAGVAVGSVSRVDLAPPEAPRQVVVHLKLCQSCLPKIREDSVASIRTLGALGDKYVEITIGSQNAGVPGEYLKTVDPIDIYAAAEEGRQAVKKLSGIATSVQEILGQFKDTNALQNFDTASKSFLSIINSIEKGPSALHDIVFDPEFAKVVDDCKASLKQLRQMIEQSAGEEGGAAKLLLGKDYQATAQNIRKSVESLSKLIVEVEKGDGILHGLIYDKKGAEALALLHKSAQELDSVLNKDVRGSIESLRRIIREVEKGEGLMHALIFDPTERKTLQDIRKAASRLDDVMKRVEASDGTLGLLVNDPTIWEDLRKILGGVQRSRALRFIIEESMRAAPKDKKKDKDAAKEAADEPVEIAPDEG